jgi:hypothetical protein
MSHAFSRYVRLPTSTPMIIPRHRSCAERMKPTWPLQTYRSIHRFKMAYPHPVYESVHQDTRLLHRKFCTKRIKSVCQHAFDPSP